MRKICIQAYVDDASAAWLQKQSLARAESVSSVVQALVHTAMAGGDPTEFCPHPSLDHLILDLSGAIDALAAAISKISVTPPAGPVVLPAATLKSPLDKLTGGFEI